MPKIRITTEAKFKETNPRLYEDIINSTQGLDATTLFDERVWCFKKKLTNYIRCTIYNKEIKIFKRGRFATGSQTFGYAKYCCKECTRIGRRQLQIKANLEKFGTEWYQQTKEYKQSVEQTNLEKYGVRHFTQAQEVKEKAGNTNIKNHGTHSNFIWQKEQIKEKQKELYGGMGLGSSSVREKIEDSIEEKFGVRNPQLSETLKEKAKDTCISKYGVDNISKLPETTLKKKNTMLTRYGEDSPTKIAQFKDKAIRTSLAKYGTEYPIQNAEVHEKVMKSRFKRKKFTFPSGRIAKVQGYEPQALKILLETYNENDIVVGNKEIEKFTGKLMYYMNNLNRRYFPDIFVKSNNLIVEVKSNGTYQGKEEGKIETHLKEKTCLDAGFKFKLFVL